jgi:conjugal transfer pilus assembly protein TraL
MNKDSSNLVPKNLDNLPRYIIWDMYQAMIFLIIFGFSIVFKMIFLGILVGGGLAWRYGKLSSGKSRGFLLHLIYCYTDISQPQSIPRSYKRNFKG